MNFFTITTEMTQDLNLKGNELLVYAVIKSHSAGFYGTRSLLASLIGCTSLKTINNTLDSLIEKGLIRKDTKNSNGVIKNAYFAKETATQEKINLEKIRDYITQDFSNISKDLFIRELWLENFNTLLLRVEKSGKELVEGKKNYILRQVNYWNMQHKTNYMLKIDYIDNKKAVAL